MAEIEWEPAIRPIREEVPNEKRKLREDYEVIVPLREEIPSQRRKFREGYEVVVPLEGEQRLSGRTGGPYTLPERRLTKAVANLAEDIHKQLRDVRNFQQRGQERNEAYFRTLLSKQSSLENAVGHIYRRGIQEQEETLLRVLVAVEQMRVEQGEIARTVEALRLWAKLMQKTGLPADASLRSAVAALEQTVESLGGINQFVELSFPLVPGICYYKVELGSEHRGTLKALYLHLWETWKEIKSWAAE